MSMTTRMMNKIIDKLNKSFYDIGREMPKSSDNREPVAWELFVSSHLQKLAVSRRDAAMIQAIKEEVIFDSDNPNNYRTPGTLETIYSGNNVSVVLSVKQPRVLVNNGLLRTYLVDHGVSERIVDAAFEHASKSAKPGHTFTAALNTGLGNGNGK